MSRGSGVTAIAGPALLAGCTWLFPAASPLPAESDAAPDASPDAAADAGDAGRPMSDASADAGEDASADGGAGRCELVFEGTVPTSLPVNGLLRHDGFLFAMTGLSGQGQIDRIDLAGSVQDWTAETWNELGTPGLAAAVVGDTLVTTDRVGVKSWRLGAAMGDGFVSSLWNLGDLGGLAGDDVRAYVASTQGIHVFDVDAEGELTLRDTLDGPGHGEPQDVTIASLSGVPHAVVANRGAGVFWLELALLTYVEEWNDDTIDSFSWAAAASGSLILVAEGDAGLLPVDLADPGEPVPYDHFSNGADVRAVAADGPHVFLGTRQPAELVLLDVTEPDAPVELDAEEVDGPVHDVVLGEGLAFVGSAPLDGTGLVTVFAVDCAR